MMLTGVAADYAYCAEVTRTQARNFWHGIRLLPKHKRDALSAVYAFARRADDIADGDGSAGERLAGLRNLRAMLDDACLTDPVLRALSDAATRLPIPLGAFGELLDGCEADVSGRTYDTWDETITYCRQVAGSVGRLSLGVFGSDDPEASRHADSLGIALQLTNILRDIREDRATGRIYLPSCELRRWGVTLGPGDDPAALSGLVRAVAERAHEWYEIGERLLPSLDRRSAACCAAMAGIYRRLLHHIEADPVTASRARVSLPHWEKALIAARTLTRR